MTDQSQLFVQMVMAAWETQIKRVNGILDKLNDESLAKQTAPNRNSGVYLLGHLTTVSDGMIPLLGFGGRLYPELEKIYLQSPDRSGLETPSTANLRTYWHAVNASLKQNMDDLQPGDWFTKHAAVSDEDFAKDPIRNKLNLVINRTNHTSYHVGQLIYLV